jgi:hypothetical protein
MNLKEKLKIKFAEEKEKLKIKRARERTAKGIRNEKATVARHKAQEKYAVKKAEAKEEQKFKQYKQRLSKPSGFSMGGSPFGATRRSTSGSRPNPFGPATYISGGNPMAKKMANTKRKKRKKIKYKYVKVKA